MREVKTVGLNFDPLRNPGEAPRDAAGKDTPPVLRVVRGPDGSTWIIARNISA